MRMRQTGKAARIGAILISIGIFLLAACGSNSSASSVPGTSATATACAQTTRPAAAFRTAIGTVTSLSGQSLVLKTMQGANVTVTYTASTTFTQEIKLASSDLKEGSTVRVAVTNTGNTYTAVSVLVSTGGGNGTGNGSFGGFGGFRGTPGTRGNGNPCFTNRGRGAPGAGAGGNNNFRGLVGTIAQVNGKILTITDNTGASYTVTLDAQTQIIETRSATAAALKVGEPLTVVGRPGSGQGTVTANSIALLLVLPRRAPAATPTPTA